MKLGLILLGLGIFFIPSIEIASTKQIKFPGSLPKIYSPGDPIVLKILPSTYAYTIAGKAMSKLKVNYYLGAIDLYRENSTYLSGLFESEKKSNFFQNLFGQRTQSYFIEEIKLKRASFSKPTKLRFPASVQKNVIEADKQKKDAERNLIRQSQSFDDLELTDFCLHYPLKSKPVGKFGSPRYLPDDKIYYHSGLDLRAANGTNVYAILGGKVRLAEKLIVPGNIAIIEHGSGLYSLSMHLSNIKVAQNDMVKKGQLIALSGDTGRVEGPHLHWEMRWKGISLNPRELVDSLKPLCDLK